MLSVADVIVIISMSLLTSFSKSLNNYAIDKSKNQEKITILYISDALMSGLSGILLAFFFSSIVHQKIIIYVVAGVGAYLGRHALNVLSKTILAMLKEEDKPSEK